MSVVIIAYPPGGGGNHLKNILCLDKSFANSNDLDINKYTSGEREVHSTTGRNMQEYRIREAETAAQDYILHGHFGELAPWRSRINAIKDKKWIIVNIDSIRDRHLLNIRQHRLGQWGHEYYLNEEQPYLYQTEFYQSYFTSTVNAVYTISVNDLWNPNFEQSKIVQQLNVFLNKNIGQNQAQFLHNYWHNNNQIDFY
jgi:hypothetical protein